MKNRWNHKFDISKNNLYKEYILNKKSITDISDKYGFNYVSIYNWLKKYNIKLRTRRESHIGKKRPDQSLFMLKHNPTKGTHRPKSVREKISKARKGIYCGRNHPMFGRINSYKCSYGKGGKYKSIWMRSSYELKFAKYLDKNHIKWLYESKTFDLGNTTYTPDFYLPEFNLYIEVKGFWRDDAKKKFEEFKQRYCGIRIKTLEKSELKLEGVL